jgi:hypothetical protein
LQQPEHVPGRLPQIFQLINYWLLVPVVVVDLTLAAAVVVAK